MPYVIGRPSKFLALAGTIAGLMVAAPSAMAGTYVPVAPAQPASAAASCPTFASSSLLAQFGDSSLYAPIQGGTFEDGGQGWTYSNASVVSGNEPWNVVSSTDSQSLQIASGSAVSPGFCLDSTLPSFRFFASSPTGNNASASRLNVYVRWTDSQGNTGQSYVTTLNPQNYYSWQLSPSMSFGSMVPAGTTITAQLVFSSSGGSWNIDDVLLDPYAKR